MHFQLHSFDRRASTVGFHYAREIKITRTRVLAIAKIALPASSLPPRECVKKFSAS